MMPIYTSMADRVIFPIFAISITISFPITSYMVSTVPQPNGPKSLLDTTLNFASDFMDLVFNFMDLVAQTMAMMVSVVINWIATRMSMTTIMNMMNMTIVVIISVYRTDSMMMSVPQARVTQIATNFARLFVHLVT
jgi:hypothetical protein